MKKSIIMVVVVAALVYTGYAMAAKHKGKAKGRFEGKNAQIQRRQFDTSDPNMMKKHEEMMKKREEMMQARIKELEKIKELAVKENATKTAAALDKFIEQEKKNIEKRLHGPQNHGMKGPDECLTEVNKNNIRHKDHKDNKQASKE